jgi:hypothetical protein
VSRGASWLIAKREPKARWKDYPLNPSGKLSESISGLVLHALHAASPDNLRGIDQEWLDCLSYESKCPLMALPTMSHIVE